MMMIAMPIFGINQGAQPIIGYNHGAQRFDRVKKTLETAILAASGLTLFGFAVTMVFPAEVVRLFIDRNDPDWPLDRPGNPRHSDCAADAADHRLSDRQRQLLPGGRQAERGHASDALAAGAAADPRRADPAALLRPRRRLGRHPHGRRSSLL